MENEEEIWFNDYSSNQRILLVGDGDFSFSKSLALQFGSASNIFATSLDSYDILVGKYKKAKSNLQILIKLGAYTLHGVDATKMRLHSDLMMQKFDRIIFNFPHAGFHGKEDGIRLIERHKKLVLDFFANASGMLRDNGEIHVTHKTSLPFSRWNITDLAWRNGLRLIECVDFKIEDYPGYNNKRGDSSRCDEPFPLGKCSTFKFILLPAIKTSHVDNNRLISFETETKYHRNLSYHGNMNNVVLHKPLLSVGNMNHISNIYETRVRSDSNDSDYGKERDDYVRYLIEAFGRTEQSQANPSEEYLRKLVQMYG